MSTLKKTKKYIKAIMIDNKFRVNLRASYKSNNILVPNAVIDTGCMNSLMSYNYMYTALNETDRIQIKKNAILNNKCNLSFGVESYGTNIDIRTMTMQDKLASPLVRTQEEFKDIRIQGINFGDLNLSVSYDNTDICLIGMEILKDMEIYTGRSLITGLYTMIACPRDRLNQEFYLAIEREFGLAEKLNSAIVNNTLNNGGNYESN